MRDWFRTSKGSAALREPFAGRQAITGIDSRGIAIQGLMMAAFFCKLVPPRLTFAFDMSADEQALMLRHAEYWTEGTRTGHVVAYGLVGDPAGPYGIGVVKFDDEEGVRTFTNGDPAIVANRGFRYEIHPMPLGVTHP